DLQDRGPEPRLRVAEHDAELVFRSAGGVVEPRVPVAVRRERTRQDDVRAGREVLPTFDPVLRAIAHAVDDDDEPGRLVRIVREQLEHLDALVRRRARPRRLRAWSRARAGARLLLRAGGKRGE